jgi:hypothetical protein
MSPIIIQNPKFFEFSGIIIVAHLLITYTVLTEPQLKWKRK